jgi:adenylate kinase family enzyme
MLASTDLLRTVILGNGGSGKSWLAQRLAHHLDSQATDLDEIHWLPGGYNARRDPAGACAAVRALAAADLWIIEGVYGWLASEALPRATALVLLDISDDECVENVQVRGLRRGGNEASHMALIAWIREYRERRNANSFMAHVGLFDAFAGPKVRLSSRADVVAQVAMTAAGTIPANRSWPTGT